MQLLVTRGEASRVSGASVGLRFGCLRGAELFVLWRIAPPGEFEKGVQENAENTYRHSLYMGSQIGPSCRPRVSRMRLTAVG